MRILLILLSAALFGPAAFAQSIESWSDFKALVNKDKITTIDELLSHLPHDFTDGYTLVYRTRALGQQRVSASRPRVLLFGKDAKFVIAYNSHVTGGSAHPGDIESIETLAFDPSTGHSSLREIQFDGTRVPDLAKVAVNPQRCLACHTQSPNGIGSDKGLAAKGLWDPYNSWSGVYGSLSREGIDFIKLNTTEYSNFQSFLTEKPSNPRYSFLNLNPQLMSQLPPSAFIRGWDPSKMNDAVVFSDGYSRLPNQMLGMYLADYNFARIGNILASQDEQVRAAFQYLVKGISLDESFAKPDIDENTNATDLTAKTYTCLAKISSFLPDGMAKVPYAKFADILLQKLRADYSVRKAAVEVDNMGLSKLGAGYDPADPFDENRTPRGLEFDSVNVATKFHLDPSHYGLTGNAALFYLFYLMGIPSQDISTAVTRGTNFAVDSGYVLSGSTNLYYGDASRCYNGGMVKSSVRPYDIKHYCFTEGVEEFFTHYLPSRFFEDSHGKPLDPQLDQLTCDELAARSKAALSRVLR